MTPTIRIENIALSVQAADRSDWLSVVSGAIAAHLDDDCCPLRFAIVDLDGDVATIECTVIRFDARDRYAERLRRIEVAAPRKKQSHGSRFGVVQIVPTGVRCEFGGFAGDATPATNLLAAAADFIVTHPNAVNASELNEMADNVLYVEGRSLDDFLLGHLALAPTAANRVGTFIDPTGAAYHGDIIHVLNAARGVKGIDCRIYTMLREELGVSIEWTAAGCASGTVLRPDAILDGCESLLAEGVDAVGGVSVIHGVTSEMFSKHLRGEIPNPSGAVEAIITHLISKIFRIPTAHAPLPYYRNLKDPEEANPRASAEFISTPHYFCVLKGLARAPRLVPLSGLDSVPAHLISVNDVGAIVAPATCLGGIPALAAEFSRIPLIAVRENRTILDISNAKMRMPNVVEVESYLEAAGLVLALRRGIAPASLRRPLDGAKQI